MYDDWSFWRAPSDLWQEFSRKVTSKYLSFKLDQLLADLRHLKYQPISNPDLTPIQKLFPSCVVQHFSFLVSMQSSAPCSFAICDHCWDCSIREHCIHFCWKHLNTSKIA